MTIEQAMAIVAQVCADFKGTLRDHQNIQQALQTVQDALDASKGTQRAPTAQETQRDATNV